MALPVPIMVAGLTAGLLTLALTRQIDTAHVFIDLVLRGAVAVLAYTTALLALSARARAWLSVALKRAPPSAVGLS